MQADWVDKSLVGLLFLCVVALICGNLLQMTVDSFGVVKEVIYVLLGLIAGKKIPPILS